MTTKDNKCEAEREGQHTWNHNFGLLQVQKGGKRTGKRVRTCRICNRKEVFFQKSLKWGKYDQKS